MTHLSCPNRRRRAMTLMEIMLVIATGTAVGAVALALFMQMNSASRMVDFRFRLLDEVASGLDRVEAEFDYIFPSHLAGYDMTKEAFEADRVRFWSTRDLRNLGMVRLVEISLVSDSDEGGESSSGLVLREISREGDRVLDEKSLMTFAPDAGVTLSFDYADTPAADEARRRPGRITVTLRVRSDRAEGPPLQLTRTWLMPEGAAR